MRRDSTGRPIKEGDRVKFRGCEYTIHLFLGPIGSYRTQGISFKEPCHTTELADETNVDLVDIPES